MLTALLITWLFILIAWFCPGALKLTAAFLWSLAEASDSLKERFSLHRKRGLHLAGEPETISRVVEPSQLQKDVIDALIGQGANGKKARRIVLSLPAEMPLEQMFFESVKRLKEAA